MPEYYCVLTDIGEAKLAQAGLLGAPLEIAEIAVGNGNLQESLPTAATRLIAEQYRAPVGAVYSPDEDPSVVIVEMNIPTTVGGWSVNELALIDAAGDVVAVANYPATWKPVVTDGTGRVLLIRVMVDVGSADHVELLVDPAMVMATRQYVNNSVEAARKYTDGLVAGVVRYYEAVPAQNLGSLIYVWPLGIMRWFGAWYRSVECGRISLIGRPTPEPGTIKANGAILNKADAPGLWSWAQEAGVVVPLVSWKPGTPFYAEISATQFMVPDLRAEHGRAWDDGRGVDAGRGFGSWQDSANKSHAHTASSDASGGHTHDASSGENGGHAHTASSGEAGGHSHSASSDSKGAHSHQVKEGSTVPAMPGGDVLASGDDVTQAVGSYSSTSTDGSHTHNITVDAVANHAHAVTVDAVANHAHTVTVDAVANHDHTITVDASGGSESRGRNVALLAVIHL